MKEEKVTRPKRKAGRTKKHPTINNEAITSIIKNHPCKDDNFDQRLRLLMYLRRLYHHLDVAWEKELTAFNLTPAQHLALLTIITAEGLSMTDLADLCLWNRSTASRISRSLQNKKLISITPVDGKTSALKPTRNGHIIAAQFLAKEMGEFEHSLMIIAEEASETNNVYQWIEKVISYLISSDAANYVEEACNSVKISNSTKQPLQSQAYWSAPSDS